MTERLPTPTISRRRVLSLTGATLTGGAVVAFGGSGTAQAQASVTELDVNGTTHEGEDSTVSDVTVSVSGNYQYTTEQADEYSIGLLVEPEPDSENWQVVDETTETAMATSTAGDYSLSGSVLSHDALSAGEFSAEAAETMTKEIGIMVAFDVYAGGEVQVSAIAETSATVEVTSTAVDVTAEVTGSGDLEVAV